MCDPRKPAPPLTTIRIATPSITIDIGELV
jgi:hypothetical protein